MPTKDRTMALAFSGGKDAMACLHLLRDQLDCLIFIDTGFTYPETIEAVNYAASLVPTLHVVQTDRRGQNERWGIPADVIPVDWTVAGELFTGPKVYRIQSYAQCHFENVGQPLWDKAKALGVTHLVYGSRKDESHNATTTPEEVREGITILCPLADWTAQQVLEYLATKMTVPEHYYQVPDSSSLDCYDCTAFEKTSQNRLAWTKAKHPQAYAAYAVRHQAVMAALQEALALPVPQEPAVGHQRGAGT